MKDNTRILDIILSLTGLIFLSPLFLLLIVIIKLTSKGSAFYKQKRVGKNGVEFTIYKFRTMQTGQQGGGLLTVGKRDSRITPVGYRLRKYKLDELPQLCNVLINDMSLVGPRPEVKKFTDLYNDEQKNVLQVKPGITDFASVAFSNESELLAAAANPEEFYIKEILPAKIILSMKYIENKTIQNYFIIIINTLFKKM